MAEQSFLAQLEDLTGKVAIVTGGAAGIGLETTIYLAARGCSVVVASRNEEKCKAGIAEAERRLAALPADAAAATTTADDAGGKVGAAVPGKISFHKLDLSSIGSAEESARGFLEGGGGAERLDIVVANAGISMTSKDELGSDGWEKMFATNHLGHAAFILPLVELMKKTAAAHGEARIVITSSYAARSAKPLDYVALRSAKAGDGKQIRDTWPAFIRYGDSKLANIYFANALSKHVSSLAPTSSKVFVNSCHPGTAASTGLGGNGMTPIPPAFETLIRKSLGVVGNSTIDCAKTQTFLAAAEVIRAEGRTGEFWAPKWNWKMGFKSCEREEPPKLGRDESAEKELWEQTLKAIQEAKGKQGKESSTAAAEQPVPVTT